MKRLAIATLLVLSAAGSVSAETYNRPAPYYPATAPYRPGPAPAQCVATHEIDAMRTREARRIEAGRQSGQLSGREYRALKAEQARIADHERFAKIDGCVSPSEFRRIEQELIQASAHIRQLKNNDEVAGGRRWRWWY